MTKLDIFTILEDQGYFDHGAVIEGTLIRSSFSIDEVIYPALKRDIR